MAAFLVIFVRNSSKILERVKIIVNLKLFLETRYNFQEKKQFMKVYNMVETKDLYLFLLKIWKFDDVMASELINATILEIISASKNCHGRFTASYPSFLSSPVIQRKLQ